MHFGCHVLRFHCINIMSKLAHFIWQCLHCLLLLNTSAYEVAQCIYRYSHWGNVSQYVKVCTLFMWQGLHCLLLLNASVCEVAHCTYHNSHRGTVSCAYLCYSHGQPFLAMQRRLQSQITRIRQLMCLVLQLRPTFWTRDMKNTAFNFCTKLFDTGRSSHQ